MATEIERKFKLAYLPTVKIPKSIEQGYLSIDKDRTVRVRVQDDKGFITIKGKTSGVSRPEFEYEIPFIDSLLMLKMCVGSIIKKNRYCVYYDNLMWEIDVFYGDNEGLIVAEVELESEDQKIVLPPWVGEEVTQDWRYSNSNLAMIPFKDW